MRILVWQWGRRGAGPRFAVLLADALRGVPGVEVFLSLSGQAEILRGHDPPKCDLAVPTYEGVGGFLGRAALSPVAVGKLAGRLEAMHLDAAICAMAGPLDLQMAAALRRCGVPFTLFVHDADIHPGDGLPLQMHLQKRLTSRADGLAALSTHVAERLARLDLVRGKKLLTLCMPPFVFGPPPPPPSAHGGKLRLLSFGRLLPYKGLDLLADALKRVLPRPDVDVRVVGSGPESADLATLRALPGVQVENRWVPEGEVPHLLAWADALILSHREASQSGVAAAAVAAGRWVVATRVGGLAEQLDGEELALLCEPTPASLAAAVVRLIENPPPLPPVRDPRLAWRRLAESLAAEVVRRPAA
jgi:glycosyltransferase involved in cell wall biosynthesis